MKVAIFLFTVYMLGVSLVPCSDGGGGIIEMIHHLLGVEHLHPTDHEEHSSNCADDSCSPFCICNCCSTALDAPAKLAFQVSPPTPQAVKTPTLYSSIIISSFSSPIWQPPKFG